MDYRILVENLEKYGYKVSCFSNRMQASEYLNDVITGKTVAFGGSVTSKEMGLFESLGTHNKVIWHWNIPEDKTKKEILREAMNTDVYISSVNAIAETGEIVNIDGVGNRISSLAYGHDTIYYIIGKNKIVQNLDDAVKRARTVASPKNAKRLCRKTPCALDGSKCFDCNSPERLCRTMTITWRPMKGVHAEVIIIDEELGF